MTTNPYSGMTLRTSFILEIDRCRRDPATGTALKESESRRGTVFAASTEVFGWMVRNPEHPVGALMVSSEGACAAYYRYARIEA